MNHQHLYSGEAIVVNDTITSSSESETDPETRDYRDDVIRRDLSRVVELFRDAFEIAFLLCNTSLFTYGLAKILDVVNQIIPSAYVYDQSNWMFYKNAYGQYLCVCEMFGIECIHVCGTEHCINMGPLPEDVENYFKIPISGKCYPVIANVFATPIIEDTYVSYEIKIGMLVQKFVPYDRVVEYSRKKQTVAFTVEFRYALSREIRSLLNLVLHFGPHQINGFGYSRYSKIPTYAFVFPMSSDWTTRVPHPSTLFLIGIPKFTIHSRNTSFEGEQEDSDVNQFSTSEASESEGPYFSSDRETEAIPLTSAITNIVEPTNEDASFEHIEHPYSKRVEETTRHESIRWESSENAYCTVSFLNSSQSSSSHLNSQAEQTPSFDYGIASTSSLNTDVEPQYLRTNTSRRKSNPDYYGTASKPESSDEKPKNIKCYKKSAKGSNTEKTSANKSQTCGVRTSNEDTIVFDSDDDILVIDEDYISEEDTNDEL